MRGGVVMEEWRWLRWRRRRRGGGRGGATEPPCCHWRETPGSRGSSRRFCETSTAAELRPIEFAIVF